MRHDPRLTPATDRVALIGWKDSLQRPAYTEGKPARIAVSLTDLRNTTEGRRERQLNFGADVIVIEECGDMAFVQARLDGYCGWICARDLTEERPAITHRVSAPASHVYSAPDIKQPELHALSMGARLAVVASEGSFAALASGGYVPRCHIDDRAATDPIPLAEALLGTPYLWGGNSHFGIDCSGLVQTALTGCGVTCPGDSDLQRGAFPQVHDIRRGDLLFWPGHVAIAASAGQMIHATAWKMAVIYEAIPDALARIDAAGDGPFLGVRRPPYPESG